MAAVNKKDTRNILIVGGGIAGLTLACALQSNSQFQVEVVERSQEWSPLGAGIVLSPNATALLHDIGLEEALRKRGNPLSRMDVATSEGTILSEMKMQEFVDLYGPSYTFHRVELHEALLEGCKHVSLKTGVTVTSLEESEAGVEVVFSNGQSETYDLVVGADGLNSQIRQLHFPESPRKEYSGYTCWRFVVDCPVPLPYATEMWGRGKRVGLVPLSRNRVYVFLVANAPENAPSPDNLREYFSEFGGQVPPILAQLEREDVQVLHHDLCDLSHPVWYSGRVCLLGDASHGMTPNMGQGAAQAIESAWVLAKELGTAPSLEQALLNYKNRRVGRATEIMNRSRRFGAVSQWENGFARWFRNLMMRLTPRGVLKKSMHELLGEGHRMLKA